MSNFTPGPWIFGITGGEGGYGAVYSQVRDGMPYVADLYDYNGNPAEMEANGHLIAAAPEMYEILKHIFDCVEAGKGKFSVGRIEQILKKARGEECTL